MPIEHFDPWSTGDLSRHPKDHFVLADPYPMSLQTLRAFHGIIRAIIPRDPAPEIPDIEDRITEMVRRMLPYMPPLMPKLLILSVHLLDWAPVWTLTSTKPIHASDPKQAQQWLQHWNHSKYPWLNFLTKMARTAFLPPYYDQDEVHEALNYHPKPFMQQRMDLRKKLLQGLSPSVEDLIGPFSKPLEDFWK